MRILPGSKSKRCALPLRQSSTDTSNLHPYSSFERFVVCDAHTVRLVPGADILSTLPSVAIRAAVRKPEKVEHDPRGIGIEKDVQIVHRLSFSTIGRGVVEQDHQTLIKLRNPEHILGSIEPLFAEPRLRQCDR